MLEKILGHLITFDMPGEAYRGPFLPLSEDEGKVEAEVRRHVEILGREIGMRDILYNYSAYCRACDYIEGEFSKLGYVVRPQEFKVSKRTARNLSVEIEGCDPSLPALLVGAHFDTVWCSPGANDNGSGVAALLEIARLIREEQQPARSLLLVAFTNEEPPFFRTRDMGSMVCAADLRARKKKLRGMISLEAIGFYSDEPNSQEIPSIVAPLYKRIRGDDARGDFIGFFSNWSSRGFLKETVEAFRLNSQFPSEGLASPIVPGLDLSDQWSFWEHGYNGVMVTDTAMMRYPWYHMPDDTPEKLTYEPYARVTLGLAKAVGALATG